MQRKKVSINYIKLVGVFIFSLFSGIISAQENTKKAQKEARVFAAEAQESLSENNFAQAEANYRKAIAKDPTNAEAKYNLGNLYYAKDKEGESTPRLKQASETSQSKALKHKAYHNQGNAFMKQKKYEEAVEAFKNALRNNPKDDQTRYNLALAKKMLEKEQQEQDQNQDQDKDQNQDKEDQKDQQDQDKKDEGENKKDQGEDKEKGDEGDQKDKKDQSEDEKQDEGDQKKEEQPKDPSQEKGDQPKDQKPQKAKGQLSPQQIKNLLEAMENQEKEIQDKINAQKAKGRKVRTEKDW